MLAVIQSVYVVAQIFVATTGKRYSLSKGRFEGVCEYVEPKFYCWLKSFAGNAIKTWGSIVHNISIRLPRLLLKTGGIELVLNLGTFSTADKYV